jgi:hypothetical protein
MLAKTRQEKRTWISGSHQKLREFFSSVRVFRTFQKLRVYFLWIGICTRNSADLRNWLEHNLTIETFRSELETYFTAAAFKVAYTCSDGLDCMRLQMALLHMACFLNF